MTRKEFRALREIDKEKFIYSLDDPKIRLILALRYLENGSWRSIAYLLGKGTPDSVRIAEKRFWERLEENDRHE